MFKLILDIISVGIFGESNSNPPYTNILVSTNHDECLNLWILLNLDHSDVSVSYTSIVNYSPTLPVLPPITTNILYTNNVVC